MRKFNGLAQFLYRAGFVSLFFMASSLIAAPDPTTSTLERSAIEEKYKWDLSKMYASQDDWEAHYKKLEAMIKEFAAKQGKVGESANSLLSALKLRDEVNVQLEKVFGYASLRRDEDMRVTANQALFQRAQTLGVNWGESSSWFQPELLAIPEEKLREWLKQPDLRIYQHFFDDLLRTKAHILSAR